MTTRTRTATAAGRPPAFERMKGRHNLLLYICLLVIALVFILAPPSQAAGGDHAYGPGVPEDFLPGTSAEPTGADMPPKTCPTAACAAGTSPRTAAPL